METNGFLGIDVSKGYADFLLLDCNSQVLEECFQLTDDKQGRQTLRELIGQWQQKGLIHLYCGLESTGGYENNWYGFLKGSSNGSNVYVCRINPRGVKAVGDAALKRTITDEVSAENIASYMIRFPQKLNYGLELEKANNQFTEGRQHLTAIKMQVKQKVQLSNQLEKLLYQYFSEMLVYCRHGTPTWLLAMLAKYPTAAKTITAGVGNLCKIYGISEPKAKYIVQKAKDHPGVVSAQIAHVIQVTVKEILHKQELINQEKQYLTDLYKDSPEVTLLTTIKGIGLESAVSIILEIEDVNKFETASKISSYFGVHPTFKQSGDGLWGNHMSKAGRGEIRAVLYMASLSAVRYNPTFKAVYAKFRAKGMKHGQAAGVVMHKMLRVIYGMLKNKTAFDSEIDRTNQEKSEQKNEERKQKIKDSKKVNQLKKHRFQPASTEGPISRRAEQRIKKQIASQTSN